MKVLSFEKARMNDYKDCLCPALRAAVLIFIMHSGIIDLGQLLMASTAKYIDSAVFIDSSQLWTFSSLFMTNIAPVHSKTQQGVSFNKTRSHF